jgi:hypothetical protein
VAQQKGKGGPQLKWRVQQLHKDYNEGIAVGDIDGDGKLVPFPLEQFRVS